MKEKFNSVRYVPIALLYIATFMFIMLFVGNNQTLSNYYFDNLDDFLFWKDGYLRIANNLVFVLSALLIILWQVIFRTGAKNNHRLASYSFMAFLIFLTAQLILCILALIFAEKPLEGVYLYFPLLYLIPFMFSTIYCSTYMIKGSVVPYSDRNWFPIVLLALSIVLVLVTVFSV